MKVKEYQQMMNYLVRKKDKPIKREETIPERIARLQYTYDNAGTKPKHMDNPNIYTHEQKPFKKKIKKTEPLKIDITGINNSLNAYEKLNKADPIKPIKREERLEGLAGILGVDPKKI
jgi:hypothetical protein